MITNIYTLKLKSNLHVFFCVICCCCLSLMSLPPIHSFSHKLEGVLFCLSLRSLPIVGVVIRKENLVDALLHVVSALVVYGVLRVVGPAVIAHPLHIRKEELPRDVIVSCIQPPLYRLQVYCNSKP